MSGRRPIAVVDGRDVYCLTSEQWQSLKLDLRRYYAWLDSGRTADPWASGVASATRYDRIQIAHHKPSGGYDAGRCSDPEPDPALVELDTRVLTLPAHDRALLYWRIAQRLRLDVCADRLGQSPDATRDRWRRLAVRVYYRIG